MLQVGLNILCQVLETIAFIEIVVADNNSTDRTLEILKSFEEIKVISNKKNLGFGKANNQIFKYAIQNNFDYIFLLNQDAKIDKNDIKKLADIFEALKLQRG